ncbi:MAG TPA: PrsW family glutamic-type intramembrane protease [Vicinamibacteria bacterium]|nr:PrsW family glutamic-type intramembrane protease [Vicinamibacteria bacterium]
MSLYLAVSVCAVLAAILVYRYDLYNREPWYLIALAGGLGIAVMRAVAGAEHWALGFVEANPAEAAVASLLEEAARLAAVVALALAFPKDFDDPMDGIIYGSIVGLGMAVEESFHFLRARSEVDPVLLPVELVRLCGHLVMGGIAAFGVRVGFRVLLLSFAIALVLHFSWDWVALAAADRNGMSVGLTLVAAAIMLAGIGIYGALVVVGSGLSRAAFAPASVRSLWGFPFKNR